VYVIYKRTPLHHSLTKKYTHSAYTSSPLLPEFVLAMQAKEANPDLGVARIRVQLKDRNGWELSEKRVKKALADLAAAAPAGGTSEPKNEEAGAAVAATETGSWLAERPSPRGYFSFTVAQPTGAAAGVVLFGGEYYDNAKNLFYNQLYRLDVLSRYGLFACVLAVW